jgi:GTPase involved in cell partitioning and DNA repair
MKRVMTSMIVGAAMMMPSVALSAPSGTMDYDVMVDGPMGTFETEEECEEFLADQRNMMSMEMNLRGREKGQFNRQFNRENQCEEMEDGGFDFEDDMMS